MGSGLEETSGVQPCLVTEINSKWARRVHFGEDRQDQPIQQGRCSWALAGATSRYWGVTLPQAGKEASARSTSEVLPFCWHAPRADPPHQGRGLHPSLAAPLPM